MKAVFSIRGHVASVGHPHLNLGNLNRRVDYGHVSQPALVVTSKVLREEEVAVGLVLITPISNLV